MGFVSVPFMTRELLDIRSCPTGVSVHAPLMPDLSVPEGAFRFRTPLSMSKMATRVTRKVAKMRFNFHCVAECRVEQPKSFQISTAFFPLFVEAGKWTKCGSTSIASASVESCNPSRPKFQPHFFHLVRPRSWDLVPFMTRELLDIRSLGPLVGRSLSVPDPTKHVKNA